MFKHKVIDSLKGRVGLHQLSTLNEKHFTRQLIGLRITLVGRSVYSLQVAAQGG